MELVRTALAEITGAEVPPAKAGPDRYLVTVRMNREMDAVDSFRRYHVRSYWPNYEELLPVRQVPGVRPVRRIRRVGILPGYVFAEVDPCRDFTDLLDRIIGAFDVVRTASGVPLLITDDDVQIIRKIEIGLNTPKEAATGHGEYKIGHKVRFVDDLLGRWPAGRIVKLAREGRISVQLELMGRKVSITVLPHQIERT
nr:transcription termination/antitermination NusG family protein [Bradyrhizobium retamae]